MKFKELLDFIPEETLDFLAAETKVDHQVKKLKGSILFKLILYSMLENKSPSLRVMESYFNSSKFKMLSGLTGVHTKYNSISDRMTTINSDYFKCIFEFLFDNFNKHLKEEKAIQIYDSTMVALSSSLLRWGMKVGSKTNKVQLKFTIGVHGSLPCTVKIFDEQSELCEDNTIPKVILDYKLNKAGVVVFDRGVQKRTTFTKMVEEDIIFVTRIKTSLRYHLVDTHHRPKKKHNGILLEEDLTIYFNNRSTNKPIRTPFRLIKAKIEESKEDIFFITNNFELPATEIADIYKERWKIEVFFKFLKQELNFKHLINRSPNGVNVTLYMTLILAMLIIVYKKLNALDGYKIVKLRIANEVHDSLIRDIVILSGGDPNLIAKYLNDI